MLELAWLVPVLPLAAMVVVALFTLRQPRLSGIIIILSIFGSFLLSLSFLPRVLAGETLDRTVAWFLAGGAQLNVGWSVDPLAAVMLVIVTTVSLLVQIYSQGYMSGDSGYSRYYAFMGLFTASMLGLVLANNFLVLYMTWELVGLCSYLLIGHWYQRPAAAAAAKKAFIVTRLGDFGFLVGILIFYNRTGTFAFGGIEEAVKTGVIGGGLLTVAMVLVFSGAVGKSAQFPLHVWLPDAMEGPTPVSALIHAATMVAAGVYLVARTFHLFAAAPDAAQVVAGIGAFTAFLAATMGVVMFDFKRVLAYSTISQLGYMMLGLGVGAFGAGVFHLFTHAFFKALLFLSAGSVIHMVETQDIREVGGLGGKMRITATTFLVGALALAGFPGFSGFWSKDEILTATWAEGQTVLFWLALFTAALTAFYIFRVWFSLFLGPLRFPVHSSGHGGHEEPRESPPVMTIPLILLAVPAALAGHLGAPLTENWFGRFLEGAEAHAEVNLVVMGASTAAALAGIGLAWLMYGSRQLSSERVTRLFGPLYPFILDKYKLDWLYEEVISRRIIVGGIGAASNWFDVQIIDGIVNGFGRGIALIGDGLRRAQTGVLQNYGLAVFAGVVAIALISVITR
ncbi:MAG: NADH-quinone oxidoreductase subunit L [Chloroflexi bacterium]|nr:NADH-quinone oxidoreductase subunit L [Chloroflexota bacterium]